MTIRHPRDELVEHRGDPPAAARRAAADRDHDGRPVASRAAHPSDARRVVNQRQPGAHARLRGRLGQVHGPHRRRGHPVVHEHQPARPHAEDRLPRARVRAVIPRIHRAAGRPAGDAGAAAARGLGADRNREGLRRAASSTRCSTTATSWRATRPCTSRRSRAWSARSNREADRPSAEPRDARATAAAEARAPGRGGGRACRLRAAGPVPRLARTSRSGTAWRGSTRRSWIAPIADHRSSRRRSCA